MIYLVADSASRTNSLTSRLEDVPGAEQQRQIVAVRVRHASAAGHLYFNLVDGASGRVLSRDDYEIKVVERRSRADAAQYVLLLREPIPLGTRSLLRLRLALDDREGMAFREIVFSTAEPFRVAVYAPLAEAPLPPDVVLVRGHARQIMLVAEAARAAGLAGDAAAMGRPACAMIPAVLSGPGGVTSLGCIGNRVYTGLGDDELYFTIPGPRVGDVVERLETVVRANQELEKYHEGRRAIIGSP